MTTAWKCPRLASGPGEEVVVDSSGNGGDVGPLLLLGKMHAFLFWSA